jgi:hypothetical protein
MTATRCPPPPFNTPFLDGGQISNAWQLFLAALYQANYGEGFDKTDAAYQTALAAAPATAQVAAVGGLHGIGAAIGASVGIALYRAMGTAASLPVSGNAEGDWAYALDGRKTGESAGAGTGVPVWWSAGAWYAADSGAVVTS